jgi:hypothetical protein
MTAPLRSVAKFVRVTCDCHDGQGVHIIDLYAVEWNDKKLGFYTCNTCKRPLICRGEDGQIYYVGERI